MSRSFADAFPVNGALPAPWSLLSGAATVASNKLQFSTAPSSNPLAVVDLGLRSNGRADVDVSVDVGHVYGCALYPRVVDANNWVRALVRSYQSSYQYYDTEYYWQQMNWYDTYQGKKLQRQVQYKNGCTYTAWSGWDNNGFARTGCRDAAQATNATVYGSACGGAIQEFQVILSGPQTDCVTGKNHYQQQTRTRTETQAYATKWVDDGYALAAGETFTGSTQVINTSTYSKISSNQSATNPGQTTTANGAYDTYSSTSLVASGTYYWAVYAADANDVQASPAQSRQVGPYTGTSTYYGQVLLEQCVAGAISTLGTYSPNSTSAVTLRVVANGDAVQVYRAGSLVINVTASAHKNGRYVGVGGGSSPYNATTPSFDNFSAKGLSSEWVRVGSAWVRGDRRVRVGTSWVGVDKKTL